LFCHSVLQACLRTADPTQRCAGQRYTLAGCCRAQSTRRLVEQGVIVILSVVQNAYPRSFLHVLGTVLHDGLEPPLLIHRGWPSASVLVVLSASAGASRCSAPPQHTVLRPERSPSRAGQAHLLRYIDGNGPAQLLGKHKQLRLSPVEARLLHRRTILRPPHTQFVTAMRGTAPPLLPPHRRAIRPAHTTQRTSAQEEEGRERKDEGARAERESERRKGLRFRVCGLWFGGWGAAPGPCRPR
jgi:hypothetical protein